MTYLIHVTLNTGQRSSYGPDEISPDERAAVLPLLALAEGETAPMPAVTPDDIYYRPLTIKANVLSATVTDGAGTPLVTFAVARRATSGKRVWQMLCDTPGVPLAVDRERQPPAPWLATIGWPATAIRLMDILWITRFQVAVAWAWLGCHDSR